MIPFFDRVKESDKSKPWVDVAEVISLISDPFGTTLLTSLILVKFYNPTVTPQRVVILLGLFLLLLIPLGYLGYSLKTGKIKDVFISDRRERYTFLILTCAVASIFNLVLWVFNAPKVILAYSLAALILAFLLTLITFKWKISGHTSALTLNVLTIILVFGFDYSWLLVLIPIVAIARLILKVHTLEQVVGGTVLSTIVLVLVFNYFGLIQLY